MTVVGPSIADWRSEFFEFEDATFLSAAAQAPMPRVSIRTTQAALQSKQRPHPLPDHEDFDLPKRVRSLLARLIQAEPGEIALTGSASGGLAAVANGFDWTPGDEILGARSEFPAHFTTWFPVAPRYSARVVVIEPREHFFRSEDFIAHITSHTRLVSVSLVRLSRGSM